MYRALSKRSHWVRMGANNIVQDKKYVSIIGKIDTILSNTKSISINKKHRFVTNEVDKLYKKFDKKSEASLLINLTNIDYKLATTIEIIGLIILIGVIIFF